MKGSSSAATLGGSSGESGYSEKFDVSPESLTYGL
jgi:hypothetical protein